MNDTLHADTGLGAVTLRVSDTARSLAFYEKVIGLQRGSDERGQPALGAGRQPLVILREVPGARPARRAAGLYHFAILLPARADLGRTLRRLAEAGVGIGQADHLVSEALYLSDPDGNGIEIYRDRPRSEWKWVNGTVQMATDPLDLEDLLREGDASDGDRQRMPVGTRMGHVHLQAGDLGEAVRFYHELVGFDLVADWAGAAFLSAGGYHHHLGLNTWASRGSAAAPEGSTGLASFEIRVPSVSEAQDVRNRLGAAGVPVQQEEVGLTVRDPLNIEVRIRIAEAV